MNRALLLILLAGCGFQERSGEGFAEAPDFALATLEGDTLRLSELRGQVVVLNFWATWCAPCLEEIPELVMLHEGVDNLTVVGISLDTVEASEVAAFATRLGITYPVLLDNPNRLDRRPVAELFEGVWALPTTIVLDPRGRIREQISGIAPIRAMMPDLEKLANPAHERRRVASGGTCPRKSLAGSLPEGRGAMTDVARPPLDTVQAASGERRTLALITPAGA